MPNTNEQRLDLIENCNILLKKFKGFEQVDDTPEGRMIAQLNWLKERAENNGLPLPVDEGMLGTLRYIYTDGTLSHHASNPDDRACIYSEIELPMIRLLSLAREGELLLKPKYHHYALRYMDALLKILLQPERPLKQYEQGVIDEVKQLRQILADNKTELPLMSHVPDYKNLIEVRGFSKVSIDDLPNGKALCKTVESFMFEGIRPDSWLTPEDADRETQAL
ncbi:MAG: hypothetical protein ACKE51_09725 [Methylococcaceae bacterium]